MKVGLSLPNSGKAVGKNAIDEIALLAEKYEFDSVWTVDHILAPKDFASSYGNTLESLASLAYLAGKTEHVYLGTAVIVFPMREVVLFAKQAAALQILSNNRALLGVGAGWLEQEFVNVGAKFSDRGQYYDEGIQLFRWLMRGNAEFSGEFYTIEDGVFGPTPKKEIPLYVGGNSGQSLRRAAKLGDGWFPIAISAEELKKGKQKLERLTDRRMELLLRLNVVFSEKEGEVVPVAENSAGDVNTRLAGTVTQILDQISDYKKAGLNHLVCYFGDRDLRILKLKVSEFAKQILRSL